MVVVVVVVVGGGGGVTLISSDNIKYSLHGLSVLDELLHNCT